MNISLDQLMHLLINYKYLILIPLVYIEGPIATILTGFLTSLGYFRFIGAYVFIVFADFMADMTYYALGKYGRKPFVDRWGKYLGISYKRVMRIEEHFEKHAGKTIMMSKLTLGVGMLFLVAAGLAKVPVKKFAMYDLLFTSINSLVLLTLGYYFGYEYKSIDKYLNYTGIAVIVVLAMLIIANFAIKKIISMKKRHTLEDEDAI